MTDECSWYNKEIFEGLPKGYNEDGEYYTTWNTPALTAT